MIVNFFENNRNVCRMAKKFNIEPKQVCDWIKKKEKMLEMASHITKIHSGKLPKYPNLEDNLFLWITEKRANENTVTQKLIICKAIALSKDQEFMLNNPSIVGFKFLSKQFDGFLRRYDLSEYRKTTVAQRLPSELVEFQ